MSEVSGSRSWQEDLASLIEDTGVRYHSNEIGIPEPVTEIAPPDFIVNGEIKVDAEETESFKDQFKGFLKASAEMLQELARGCRDIVHQSLVKEDSFLVRKFRGPWGKVCGRLKFLNRYLPEDRDPVHAWPVVFFVFILALSVLTVNTEHGSSVPQAKKVYIHPPSASHILLPDGRKMAYRDQGVQADRARFSLIAPHSFLSSRLAGIPGVKASLLEDFGVRLITFDLPGFGESDPHPNRNLNTSALDTLYLANEIGVGDKFWMVGYSSGAIHAWAALRYIPNRIAGAAMFSPWVNPYEPSMTQEEKYTTWEKWTPRRKLMYILARRFPKLLSLFYRQSFLSGKHGQLDKWLSLTLGKKDGALIEDLTFEEFWQRDVEESIRQGSTKPFVEEAVLQVSNWGFSLKELEVAKHQGKSILAWIKSIYSKAEQGSKGFPGPIHIWQGMDDLVVPTSMINFVQRVLPEASVHKLPFEGHFSYYYFCDECHRQIFYTLFGTPQGPLNHTVETDQTSCEADEEYTEQLPLSDPATE